MGWALQGDVLVTGMTQHAELNGRVGTIISVGKDHLSVKIAGAVHSIRTVNAVDAGGCELPPACFNLV